MTPINLSDEEKHLLRGYFTTSPIALIRLKAQAILMRNRKMKLEDIAELVFRDIRSKAFWDIPTLKEYVRAEFGIVYESVQSYHFLLKFSRLSFKYPDRFNLRRDEEAIKKRMFEIREEIAKYLSDPSWEVFASDETRLQLEAINQTRLA